MHSTNLLPKLVLILEKHALSLPISKIPVNIHEFTIYSFKNIGRK